VKLLDRRISDFEGITNMKNIVTNAILIAASAGLIMQQTVAQPTVHEMRNDEQVIRISASNFEFKPSEILVRKGVPVTLELISQDRHHGFKLAEFHLRADIKPGVVEKVRFVPDKVGTFTFICDVFCGDGHEEMSGTLRVIEQ
jgi:cytochrome c oxidase subunit 2